MNQQLDVAVTTPPRQFSEHPDVGVWEARTGVALGPAVECAVYVDGKRLPGTYTYDAALATVRELGRGFAWAGLDEPDQQQLTAMAHAFGLHPLTVQQSMQPHQRPKLEFDDSTLVFVLKTVNYVEHESLATVRKIIQGGEIVTFMGADFVLTVRHGGHVRLADVRAQLDAAPDRLRLGPSAVLPAIADHVVHTYLKVTDQLETDIDLIEENVFSPTNPTAMEHIYLLKREIVELRRAVVPLTLTLGRLGNDANGFIPTEVRRYLRDVLDHTVQAADRITGYDELLSSLVQSALGKVATQQNMDMRKISAWVAMAAVPTVVTGIYSMNFDAMPGLHWFWGYPASLLLMLAICGFLYALFRRRHWL
ncbi:magnesium transporter [Mycobacterium sp. IEC1808]|uniref:magnesium and cobalt transport protein CorA n=1 Tax=Mycobacterium sp. IEC1808 TaxID=1743230 RepID=UPI000A157D7B|nr:magnesium and cobalt transport protein CorA [Mycobacterium sp. IEC1808]ORW84504.1 magnesium transporter [Mycobacterium sp. IEC1808]